MPEKKPIDIPPRGTRGTKMPFQGALMKIAKPFADMQVSRYRRAKDATAPMMMGFPTVLLTTVGARSGRERTHVLGGFADGDEAWLVMASNGGAPTHPAWFINLAKSPNKMWLEVGNRKLRVEAELLQGKRRDEALAKITAIAPRYGVYETKTDRAIPIIRLTPAGD
jgi:deazaflavin-dependent oxidoreductase (nitroreductase family)